jgi:Domain of unknown function (DUF4402)
MKTTVIHKKRWLIKIFLVIVLGFMCNSAFAQTDPTDSLPGDPGALTIYTVQNMSFGAFSIGNSGGSVIISNSGTRSVTGDVLGLNMGAPYFNAIFDVSGPQGAIVSILNGSDVTLTGSNGGSMLMHIGNSNPASPFIITVAQPARTQVNIGGTLTVGNTAANPPGTYNGTFYITFNLE